MRRITLKGGAIRMAKTSKVTERLEKQQHEGFIVILLILTILVVVVGASGCAAFLAVLTGTGSATAPQLV